MSEKEEIIQRSHGTNPATQITLPEWLTRADPPVSAHADRPYVFRDYPIGRLRGPGAVPGPGSDLQKLKADGLQSSISLIVPVGLLLAIGHQPFNRAN
ncbi:hypothetical protein NPIL_136331 [Nephila pilipes]|uniref:Uncharacterized protein n=1 Tax=Nephila pilipes TaxID=299642 RepID=A0A8X6Q2W2_NEPPI|nr:hypothetical protein NPIL_136331 [Nephila pilipes]